MANELVMSGLTEGRIVHFVDETPGDYNHYDHKPALVQHVYAQSAKGYVHLRIFEAYPQDDCVVDAHYSEAKEPGTWHWPERV